jgi:hypothetical protein
VCRTFGESGRRNRGGTRRLQWLLQIERRNGWIRTAKSCNTSRSRRMNCCRTSDSFSWNVACATVNLAKRTDKR